MPPSSLSAAPAHPPLAFPWLRICPFSLPPLCGLVRRLSFGGWLISSSPVFPVHPSRGVWQNFIPSCGRILSPRMDSARSVRPRTCWWPPGLLPLWLLLRTWVCEHLSGSLPSLWGTCPGVGLLDHMVVLCWILRIHQSVLFSGCPV